MYIHGIYQGYRDVFNIYLVYTLYIPCISNGLDTPCIYHVYTWYIHKSIYTLYTKHIQGMVPCRYTTYILGIYQVYQQLFQTRFFGSPGSWSLSMRTRVWVIKRELFHTSPGQPGQAGKAASKRLRLTSPSCRLCLRHRQASWFLPSPHAYKVLPQPQRRPRHHTLRWCRPCRHRD